MRNKPNFGRRRHALTCACFLSALALAQNEPGHVTFQVHTSPQDLVLENEVLPTQQTITHLRLRGIENEESPGLPRLPVMTRWIALPPGAQVVQVAAQTLQDNAIEGVRLLAWGQPPNPGRDPIPPDLGTNANGLLYYGQTPAVGPDPVLQQTQVWPQSVAHISEVREAAGYRMASIAIRPVQWLIPDGRVVHHADILVDVVYVGGQPVPQTYDYPDYMARDDLRATVVNPDAIVLGVTPPRPEELHANYLIITDNFYWNTDKTRGGAVTGDMIAEFNRLAAWKNEKGLRAAVVTITDILDGRYGNFTRNTRDLQEVLRNFLKHALREWKTYWVLLGGDVGVISPRYVVLPLAYYKETTAERPAENECYWDAATATLRLRIDGRVVPESVFSAAKTGQLFRLVPSPSAATPGWAYCDASYTTFSDVFITKYVLVRGLAAADLPFFVFVEDNTIPTDLYYASLLAPSYDLPGLHDWDLNDNGYYGQLSDTADQLDGVSLAPQVAIGRAPVENGDEARTFVDKVLAYERYSGLPPGFYRKVLYGSTNWGGGPAVGSGGENPPKETTYYAAAGATEAILHFKGPPGDGASWKLIAWNAPGDWREVPYNKNADAASLGYYYCRDDSYATRSEIAFDLFGSHFEFPLPTSYVKVRGPAGLINPSSYFFDDTRPDLSVLQKEALRRIMATAFPELDQRQCLYQDFADTPPTPDLPDPLAEISEVGMHAALDSGYNIVSLSGHGNWWGCCDIDISWVPALVNGHAGGLVYADSCLTNRFDIDDTIGERFLTTATGGAAAYVGNSRYSWFPPGASFEQAFWKRLATTRAVGKLLATKAMIGGGHTTVWTNYALNLLGDPEMPLWRGTPRTFAVSHPAKVKKGNFLLVHVADALGTGMVNAMVCLSSPRGTHDCFYTDGAGNAAFDTRAFEVADSITITVTADDYLPYRGSVLIEGDAIMFIRADTNSSGSVDIADAIFTLSYLFARANRPSCLKSADANDDGDINIADAIAILSHLFAHTGPLPEPFGACGNDQKTDSLTCDSFVRCQ